MKTPPLRKQLKSQRSSKEGSEQVRHSDGRRRLLQTLIAGGAAVTVQQLPERWAKPILDTTTLPAHAQATCTVQSLDCSLDAITGSSVGTISGPPSVLDVSPDLPVAGLPAPAAGVATVDRWSDGFLGNCGGPGTLSGIVPSATLSFSATVTPPCATVDLEAVLSSNDADANLWGIASGGNQSGVVDTNSGAVAFNNIMVNFSPPNVSGTADSDAVLDVRIRAPGTGVPDCVIDISFTEDFNCNNPP